MFIYKFQKISWFKGTFGGERADGVRTYSYRMYI